MMKDGKEIAARLKKVRQELKLTQLEMAKRLGISPTLMSKIESGERAIQPRHMENICLAFHVSEKYLTTGEGDMFSEDLPDAYLNKIAMRYGLGTAERIFIATYLTMPEDAKKAFNSFLTSFIHQYISAQL